MFNNKRIAELEHKLELALVKINRIETEFYEWQLAMNANTDVSNAFNIRVNDRLIQLYGHLGLEKKVIPAKDAEPEKVLLVKKRKK